MNDVSCIFLLTGFLLLVGCDAFQLGANNRAAAAPPTLVTARILGCPNECNIRPILPRLHESFSFTSKLYYSPPNDSQASLTQKEDVPPNIAWLYGRFNFKEEFLSKIAVTYPTLLTMDQYVLDNRANWLQNRLKMSEGELGITIRRFPYILTCRPDTNLGPKLDYLQERLALDTNALSKVVQKQPSMLYSGMTQTLEPKLNWLQKRLLLNETKALQKYVAQVPEILTLSIDDNLEPKYEWLQERLNITESQTANLCIKAPKILTYSLDKNLVPTLNWLQDRLDLNRVQLGKMIRRAPGILHYRVESLEEKLIWLQVRLCLDDASLKKIVIRFPTVFGYSASTNLEPTLRWLENHLFLSENGDTGKLIDKFPALLGMSIETNLEPTFDFFKECIGDEAAVGLVLKNPAVIGASLEGRLKLRLRQAEQIGIEVDAGCLQRMAKMTEEKWYRSLEYQEKKLAKSNAKDLLW